MSRGKFVILFTVYCLLLTAFTIYSYTQVDLNLTLSSNSMYQFFQHQLTQIGYFNRPLSTNIFFFLLFSSIFFYFLLLKFHNSFSTKQIWTLLVTGSLLLVASYPALAHDIFNYMFDARILVKYQQNPWTMTPLDFPHDEWTRFMRWTHVSSVYPPGWLITSIPFYLLGFEKFTLTLFSFKWLGFLSFLGSSWLILKLAGRKSWILWSFNPMILIESLSSVHNEIAMVVFTLLAFYLSQKRTILSKVLLVWAGLIKYVSFLLLPFLNRPTWAAIAAWIGALTFFYVREINPWYIMLPIAISFMSKNKFLTSLSLVSSLLIMYRYYPCVAIFSC